MRARMSRRLHHLVLAAFLALLLLPVLPGGVQAATRTVTTAADSGPGSLRDAIASAGAGDTINLSIGGGAQTIFVASALPPIVVPITIDGTTQPGYSGQPLVEVMKDIGQRLRDMVAHQRVVGHPAVPWHAGVVRERRLGDWCVSP